MRGSPDASEHVMTVAPIFARYLANEKIKYDVIAHEPTMTSSRTAQACHIPGDRVVKGIVLRGDDVYTLAVLPASRRIRMTDLKARIGHDVALASEAEIDRLFRD